MVTRFIFSFLFLPFFLFSGEFTASVSRNQINLGESFTLNLSLKDVSAKENPSIDSLTKSFTIHSQQQMYNNVITNGRVTSSITWKLTLMPQSEGEVVIPSLSIDTADGILSTTPITIQVVKGTAADRSDSSAVNDVILTTDVNNAKPYKNEPVVYTVRIVSRKDLANIQMQKIDVENAIVERNGEARIYKKVVDGKRVNVIEFDYHMTPLKAGPLKIPSAVVQGVIPTRRKTHHESSFDDDFDPFSMMQGFNQLKPFALATEEVLLDVQPAIAGMNPWLPAKSLTIEEIWNESQSLRMGEPFTRGFKIVAEGIKSSQLPSLNDLQMSDNHFKIYADKPESGDEEKNGIIKSYRKEQYTLIPQQSGTLTLPELSVVWWDVVKNEKVITHIPSRMLQILPESENTLKSKTVQAAEEALTVHEPQDVIVQRDPLLYALIAGLVILLFATMVWVITLQKKIIRLKEASVNLKNEDKRENYARKAPHASDKREKLPDLNPT